jgi:putative ABC transport system permease protein
METLNQILAVTAMNLRAIPGRLGASLVVVFGMAAVVAVVLSVLSMSSGFLDTVRKSGRPDRALITSGSAFNEFSSRLPRGDIATIIDAPGVKRDGDGKPIATAEAIAFVPATKTADGLHSGVLVRGLGPNALEVMPQVHLTAGRMFKPGLHELIVGALAQSEFQGFKVGDRLSLPQGDWTIVGSFESNGDQHEAELLGDAETVMTTFRRDAFNTVVVMLDSPAAFDGFKDALTTNASLNVEVNRETDYLAKQSKPLNDFLTLIAYAVGGIMGLGATFGALNTMYAAVSARAREIATLRAIGFGAGAVVVSVMAEALLLTVAGALIGAAAAWLLFNGHKVVSGISVYAMTVSPALLLQGLLMAAGIGAVGGLLPAIRAARLPVATALRAN